MTLFLDLDGPILDVAARYHRVHQELVGPSHAASFTTPEFWELKRERIPVAGILQRCGVPPDRVAAYSAGWLSRIEAEDQLGSDVVHAGVQAALTDWSQRHPLVLVTLRQQAASTRVELERLGLAPLFAEVWVGNPIGREGWTTKADLIRGSRLFHPEALMIGDTEIDLRAGRLAGLRTVGVLTGIRSRRLLEAERPDHLLDKLVDLPQVVPL